MRGSSSRRKKGRREVVDGESRAGPVGVKPVEWWSGGGLRAKASASASASTVHALAGVVQYSIEPSHPAPQCSAVPAARRGTRRRRLGTRPPPPPTGRAKTQPRRDAASSRDLAPGPSGQWEDPSVSERALVAGRQAEAEAGASESSVSVLAAYALDRSQRLRRTRQLHLSILNLHHLHHLYHPLSLRLSPPLSPPPPFSSSVPAGTVACNCNVGKVYPGVGAHCRCRSQRRLQDRYGTQFPARRPFQQPSLPVRHRLHPRR